jgi:hypothetical protein
MFVSIGGDGKTTFYATKRCPVTSRFIEEGRRQIDGNIVEQCTARRWHRTTKLTFRRFEVIIRRRPRINGSLSRSGA